MKTPLWHSCLCSNKHGHTYFNHPPTLIWEGVHKMKHLILGAGQTPQQRIKHPPPSCRLIYSLHFQTFQKLQLDWSVPSVWAGMWAKSKSVAVVAPY